MTLIGSLRRLFTYQDKKIFIGLLLLAVIVSLFETAGISVLMVFITMATNFEVINTNPYFLGYSLYPDLEHKELQKVQSELDAAIPIVEKQDLANPWNDNVKTDFKYGKYDREKRGFLHDYNCDTLKNKIYTPNQTKCQQSL